MLALYVRGIAVAIGVGAIVGVVSAIADGKVQVSWVVVAVLVSLLAVLGIGFVKRLMTTYTITDQRLTIDVGLLSRDVHETRLERVQNVNSSQTLLERMLRIGTVDFDTAAGAEYDFAFRGVADPHQIVRTVDRALHALQRPTAGNDL